MNDPNWDSNPQAEGGQQSPQGQPVSGGVVGRRNRMACGLIGIFLGGLGIHNFMLGFTGKAVAQLVMYIIGFLTSWLLVGIPLMAAAGIWGFIEGIIILTNKQYRDADGFLLQD